MKEYKREIKPEMIAWLDQRLALNGAAQQAIAEKDARAVFFYAMEACVGIKEIGGNNRGPLVELIQETIGRANGEAWCMALVQTCIAYAEHKTGIISRFPATEHCLTALRLAPKELKVRYKPLRGALAIWQHGTSENGHVDMYTEGNSLWFKGVGGNTTTGIEENGKIVRDGGGVHHLRRLMVGDGDMHLKAFLKPF